MYFLWYDFTWYSLKVLILYKFKSLSKHLYVCTHIATIWRNFSGGKYVRLPPSTRWATFAAPVEKTIFGQEATARPPPPPPKKLYPYIFIRLWARSRGRSLLTLFAPVTWWFVHLKYRYFQVPTCCKLFSYLSRYVHVHQLIPHWRQ